MGLFGGGNSSSGDTTIDNSAAFAQYANQMRGRMGAYDPWINAGGQARDRLSSEYGKSLDNPNWLQDSITKGFYESPYQKYMQDMVTKRMNYNATNTGMLGSGAANRALGQELTNMTGGYLNDYINRGMSTYGQALNGEQGMAGMGYQALGDQTNLFEQAAGGDLKGQMSRNAYKAAQKANSGNGLGSMIGTIGGGLIGAYFGGPMGASVGSSIGGSLGGSIGGGGGNSGGGGGGGGGMGGIGSMFGGGGGGSSGGGFNFGSMFGGGNSGSGGGYMTGASNIPGVQDFNVGNFSY